MRKRISQTYRIICSIQIFKAAVRKNVITSQLFTDDNSKSEITPRNKEIIENIVKRMDTMLKSPESILITQYDEITKENDEIYMIAKGKCRVEVTDKFVERSERFYARTLDKGDHFGEIAMVYHPCRRSATVSVEKAYYLTCAKINKANYNELLQIYPNLSNFMKAHIRKYDDPLKLFLEMSLNQIDFFKNLSPEIKSEWIFNMQLKQLEKDAFLYKLETQSSEMFVIQSGEVEIVHYLENDGIKEKFIIEKLFRGSVINHNSFLMKDGIDTDAICKTSVSVF